MKFTLIMLSLMIFIIEEASSDVKDQIDVKDINKYLSKKEQQAFWSNIRENTRESSKAIVKKLKKEMPRYKKKY